MTPELRVRNLICSYLKAYGYFFWVNDSVGIYDPIKKTFRRNNSPYRIRGVADILGVLRGGRLLAIEVKAEKGRLSPEQKLFLDQVNAAGGKAFVARSIEDVERELNPKEERVQSETH